MKHDGCRGIRHRRSGGPFLVLVACVLLAACARPAVYSSVHHRVIGLAPGDLASHGVAFITPSVALGKEEDKQVLALIFTEVLAEERPDIRTVTLPETLGLINTNGYAESYRRMYEDYRDTGIFRREILAEIGRVSGARYLAQLNLADFEQGSAARFGAFGLRLMETKRASIRLFLQIWDSDTGRIVWEGVQEMSYAYDTATEKTISFRTVVEASARTLIRELP